MATTTGAKQVLVITDLSAMYAGVIPFVSTDSADFTLEKVENWVQKFGAPNMLHTDQGKKFLVAK